MFLLDDAVRGSVYTNQMASLQRVKVRGHSYWRIVESRRVNGKPRPIVVAHLGSADQLLARLQAQQPLRLRSRSHGAVAALFALAAELDVVGTIDRCIAHSGRRDRRRDKAVPAEPARRNDGLTVGQSLMLATVGRACRATSKRAFADWASTTTLGELAGVDVSLLSSQHFWDQMDQVPVETISAIESEIVKRVVERFQLPLDTLLYDATNFFTFVATTNMRPKLPARGHNKQNRHDLRQVGVAVLCSRADQIPLLHRTYAGQVPDARSFADILPTLRQRIIDLGRDLKSLTVVYDRGNVSRANQRVVEEHGLSYVASLTAASRRALIEEANQRFEPVLIDDERVMAYRTCQVVWGAERTLVVLISERLRDGQFRGVLQHLAAARRWLDQRAATLARGKQRLDRARIERDIETRLMGRQHLRKLLRVQLAGSGRKLQLSYHVDETALEDLRSNWLGRLVLMTNRHDWSTAEIVQAYRGQADAEAVFAHLKDPIHLAIRPQFHWTDQKLHVHVFICILSYLLARLLHRRARQAGSSVASLERLLDQLERVRRVTIAQQTGTKGRLRLTTQLEDVDEQTAPLLTALGITA
jgi:transposase